MKSVDRRGSVCCKVCLEHICNNCIPKELITNPCINDNCSAVVHKKCAYMDLSRVCGHCNDCHDYYNCNTH